VRTFWRNDETASFGGTTVDGLDDINQLERKRGGRMPSMDRYKVSGTFFTSCLLSIAQLL